MSFHSEQMKCLSSRGDTYPDSKDMHHYNEHEQISRMNELIVREHKVELTGMKFVEFDL